MGNEFTKKQGVGRPLCGWAKAQLRSGRYRFEMASESNLETRSRLHAALSEPVRLAVIDQLSVSDRSPKELGDLLGVASNLLAHHLEVLEQVAVITRHRSAGDGRRRYVALNRSVAGSFAVPPNLQSDSVLFVCSANSARSQLAAALWSATTGRVAQSAGTNPAERIHPLAVAAAERAGITLGDSAPRSLGEVSGQPTLVITVCDNAHEETDAPLGWLHWSVPDPVHAESAEAFEAVVEELRQRISVLAEGRGPVPLGASSSR